jgi:hypothetical protein
MNTISDSTNNQSFIQMFDSLINLNKTKINKLKNKMNKLVENQNYTASIQSLPLYLNYIFDMLAVSYPYIIKFDKEIIKQLLVVDNYNIHPSIFTSLLINILHSISINIIIEKQTKNLNIDDKFLSLLPNIHHDVELIMSQFDTLFIDIDDEYIEIENKLGYNNISNLDYHQFNDLFNNITIGLNTYHSDLTIMNVMIIHIEHMIHHDIEKYIKTININIDDILSNLIKFDFDNNLLLDLTKVYEDSISKNYMKVKFFDTFSNINIFEQLKLNTKNVLYFWIDHIAIINNKLFKKLLKK